MTSGNIKKCHFWGKFAKKGKNKNLVGVIVQKQYVLRGTVKLRFEEPGHRDLTTKNWLSILHNFISVQC